MVHRKIDRVINAPGLSVDLADRGAREEPGHRVAAECDHHPGLDQRELALEIRRTGLDLMWQRIPVTGRPALHDVGNVDLASVEVDGSQQLVQ